MTTFTFPCPNRPFCHKTVTATFTGYDSPVVVESRDCDCEIYPSEVADETMARFEDYGSPEHCSAMRAATSGLRYL